MALIQRWLIEDAAQDLLEYALLIAFIALVAVGAVAALGNQIVTQLYNVILAGLP